MSTSTSTQSSGSVGSIASFPKRASKMISQAGLFQLVEEMAIALKGMDDKLSGLQEQIAAISVHLGVPKNDKCE